VNRRDLLQMLIGGAVVAPVVLLPEKPTEPAVCTMGHSRIVTDSTSSEFEVRNSGAVTLRVHHRILGGLIK